MTINSLGLQQAIDIAGTQELLGEKIGVAQSTISLWLKTGVPAEWCAAIEHATGVPRAEIRPDIFGPNPILSPLRRRGRLPARNRLSMREQVAS